MIFLLIKYKIKKTINLNNNNYCYIKQNNENHLFININNIIKSKFS